MTTIYDVLAELRDAATSEADKGARFERLMRAFLVTDPVYAEQFKDVWLWQDWPGRAGKHDTGIDLVAEDRLAAGYVAIQCKFYAPTSTISKDDIDTFLSASGKEGFVERIIVSTTDKWNGHAENAIKRQQIQVRRIGMSDLEASPIDWGQFSIETPEVMVTIGRKVARPHQEKAIEAVVTGFDGQDRGKLIMACGTGKTFTSLGLAQQMAGAGGSVLFLVPSISLLSQTLREWSVESEVPLRPIAVCSDRKSTVRSRNADEDIATVDLALPATTNIAMLAGRLQAAEDDTESMTVVFSTYQSIDAVARAQAESGIDPFNLIICDEAHRTTGVTLADDEDESPFVRVHDAAYIKGIHRLYMTATPRIYDDATKAKAGDADAVLVSMDNEALFGPEFFRLGFGDAVAQGLLTDYKVLVLAVDNAMVASTFQSQLADRDGELQLDDVAKIVGCWNGLAKRGHAEHDFHVDPAPMRRAVAFAGTIKASRKVEAVFETVVDQFVAVHDPEDGGEGVSALDCQVRHVDGTFNALERNTRLDWLRADVPDGTCRILTNARCLSEGVDVPALDAVMFLSPRRSVVDVIQSVGRVMRKAPGKKYGYIILPVAIPEGVTPEVALRDNARYQVVWEVLQALRAHDDRLRAEVNKIDLSKTRSDRINVIGVGSGELASDNRGVQGTLTLNFGQLDAWRDAVYARIVAKVGSRRYWEDWAKSVAQIAEAHMARISGLLGAKDDELSDGFDRFLDGLRANLNESVTRADAVEMLAQHLITRPVFDALFGGYDFAAHNPVAKAMEQMLGLLARHNLESENTDLEKFYESVRIRVQGIDTAEGRQRIIAELYDTFFSTAFRRTVDRLGIVYTPVEIVDFILRSADEVLRAEFSQGLTDENVHILDGFVGTGTFVTRLIQSRLIAAADLPRKYQSELHANEILLLAYYIAAVNIESSYQDVRTGHVGEQGYTPFPGLILTDTFQSSENGDRLDFEVFRENNARLESLKQLPITVVVGNPPYSVGQESANDNNANEEYPSLDESIRRSYAAKSSGVLLRNLYDSYVRAIRWASLRIKDRGIVAYVTNNGFLDNNAFDGLRKVLGQEFTLIYVFNLRGNQRTAGEQSRKEGGKVFGGGSRAGVAITIMVKNPNRPGPATIRYADIGDYLSREQKLSYVAAAGSIEGLELRDITPNEHGDWLSQRSDDFQSFLALTGTDGIFLHSSLGVSTSRDTWVVGSSKRAIRDNVKRTILAYNSAVAQRLGEETVLTSEISWSRGLKSRFARAKLLPAGAANITRSTYRPFFKQWLNTEPALLEAKGSTLDYFTVKEQIAFCALRPNDRTPFAVLMIDSPPNLGYFMDPGQVVPLYATPAQTDDEKGRLDLGLSDTSSSSSNVTDAALMTFRQAYDDRIEKQDIFYYCYGLLHSQDYRQRFQSDLKKVLPRIPLVTNPWPFIEAGLSLSSLHLGYESVTPYSLRTADIQVTGNPFEFYRVEKMAFGKSRIDGKLVNDRSTVKYNSQITVSGIPEEAYRYMLGSRSAIEWLMDRYRVRIDTSSGIVNDPNDWSREVGDPRYIYDLLARIVTISLETMKIVDSLPTLEIRKDA